MTKQAKCWKIPLGKGLAAPGWGGGCGGRGLWLLASWATGLSQVPSATSTMWLITWHPWSIYPNWDPPKWRITPLKFGYVFQARTRQKLGKYHAVFWVNVAQICIESVCKFSLKSCQFLNGKYSKCQSENTQKTGTIHAENQDESAHSDHPKGDHSACQNLGWFHK